MSQAGAPDPAVARGLAASASRGAVITVGGQGVRLLIQVAGLVVLARLLGPEDYGVVAVVTVVVGLGELFRDFGLSAAAVQARTLSDGQRDNLFWLNTAIGLVLAVLLCAAAPLLAPAFGDPRLTPVALALSATFVLNGVSTQYRAMHARHLRFGQLTGSEIGGQLAGVVAGVAFAASGAGFWALVVQQLVQGLVTQVLLVVTNGWLPGRIARGESVRPFIGYGTPLLGSQLLGYLAGNVDTLTIAARVGAGPLGVYNRAFQLVAMPLTQLQMPSTRVALPVLSRLRDDRARFDDVLCLGQVAMLTLTGATFAVLFAQAPAVVAVALGAQWAEAVPLLRILLLAGFFQAATYAAYWVFLARGLTRSQLRYALTTRPAAAAITVLGSAWGVQGVAVGYLIGVALTWPVSLLWTSRCAGAPARRMLLNGLRIGGVFAAASGLSSLATLGLPPHTPWLRLAVGTATVLAAAALVARAWSPFRRDLLRIAGLRRHLRRRTRRPAVAAGLVP